MWKNWRETRAIIWSPPSVTHESQKGRTILWLRFVSPQESKGSNKLSVAKDASY